MSREVGGDDGEGVTMAYPADPASVCLTQWLCHVGGRHARGRCVASAQAGEVEGKKAGGRASCMPNAGARVGVQAAECAGDVQAGEAEEKEIAGQSQLHAQRRCQGRRPGS